MHVLRRSRNLVYIAAEKGSGTGRGQARGVERENRRAVCEAKGQSEWGMWFEVAYVVVVVCGLWICGFADLWICDLMFAC